MSKYKRKKRLRFGQLDTIIRYLIFGIRNRTYIKLLRQFRGQLKVSLTLANMELGKLSYKNPIYMQRVREFNQAMIELYKGRWYATRALETHSKDDWNKAFRGFRKSKEISEKLLDLLRSGELTPIDCKPATLSSNGTEITFADGVPLVPEICPVAILQGSDYDMGYQYAQQLTQIFGPWILRQKAGRNFTEEERAYMRKWEKQIQEYAPEILDMCKGWAAGATDAGVPMSYEDVLDLWVGHKPPATNYFGIEEGRPQLPPIACSGVAAWGRATVDGRLVTGSSGDHDCTYMVTIVAFPKTGNNFIYTPFSATGDVPVVGACYLFGHPSMNNKGLAYVHHGGGPKFVEPKEHWGYGLRRATSVFHILRFANNAQEARDMEVTYPIGDIGNTDYATVGGFYADNTYGYVIESRKDPVIIREAGMMGETDFLYANNSAIHPDVRKAEWMQKSKEDWVWDEHGGWYPKKFVVYVLLSIGSIEKKVLNAMKMVYHNSYSRNQYMFNMMNRAVGRIDFEYIKMMYRRSGTVPPGSWKEVEDAYNKIGRWGDISTGNASNAFVAVMKPNDGDEGIYALCVGTAARGLAPTTPTGCNPTYGETNAFWELKLACTPAGVTEYAKQKAQEYIDQASSEMAKLKSSDVAYEPLKDLLNLAESEFKSGKGYEHSAKNTTGNESVYNWSKATRAFARAQVRALQVYQALVPPPSKPDDLGL